MARTKIFSVYFSLRNVLFPLSFQFFYQLGQLGLFELNLAEFPYLSVQFFFLFVYLALVFSLEAFLIVSQLLKILEQLKLLKELRVKWRKL